MQDKLNFQIKDQFLTDMQLEKLKKLLDQFGVDANYSKSKDDSYSLELTWDSSSVYRKSSRYAGRNKIDTNIDWNQVELLSSLGMTNESIAERLGVNIRTFYRRKNENKMKDKDNDK